MTPLRFSTVVATLLKLARSPRPVQAASGPGCSCESCVQAWDRHHPPVPARTNPGRRFIPGS